MRGVRRRQTANNQVRVRALKERLDRIDNETRLKGAAKVGGLWRLEKTGMWLKGLEILKDYPELEDKKLFAGGRGVRTGFSEVARITGRRRQTITGWVDLVKHIGKTRTQFDRWAKLVVPKVVEKWSRGLPAK